MKRLLRMIGLPEMIVIIGMLLTAAGLAWVGHPGFAVSFLGCSLMVVGWGIR